MNALKEFKKIDIIGRRWFQKTYGNTYHSVIVLVDGAEVGRVDYKYGFGNAYTQTAFEILQRQGFYPQTGQRLQNGISADYYLFLKDTVNNLDKFHFTVIDVKRKKDL